MRSLFYALLERGRKVKGQRAAQHLQHDTISHVSLPLSLSLSPPLSPSSSPPLPSPPPPSPRCPQGSRATGGVSSQPDRPRDRGPQGGSDQGHSGHQVSAVPGSARFVPTCLLLVVYTPCLCVCLHLVVMFFPKYITSCFSVHWLV